MTATAVQQLLDDATRWNQWAAQVNQRALERGLVTARELAHSRHRSQLAMEGLRRRLDAD